MLAVIIIKWWHWAGFICAVLAFLAFDLGILHRHARPVKFREAVAWTGLWVVLALSFAWALAPLRGREEALEFLTGYLIELSLSLDNVFVIALIFGYFHVAAAHQHRVLFLGIIGALVMRGLMIGTGAALVARFHWVLYVMGAFLISNGIKMLVLGSEKVEPERNAVIRVARKFFPVTTEFAGEKFAVRRDGRTALTPLALVLMMVETTDLIFAVDSIPAIFAVTQNPFIIFTSNVFAILGLRSLYTVLAGAITYFRYLKVGLSLVLVFIGAKMLIAHWIEVPTGIALIVVGCVILAAMACSVVAGWREARRGATKARPE